MKYPYSFESSVGYAFVLLISLWWLPVLGPIIIGYITGRKAGDPVKGVVAMLIPIAIYFFIIKAIAIGWVHVPHVLGVYFNSVSSASLIPYMNQTFTTGLEVGNNIMAHLYYVPSSFFIMLAFAFIGGAMSRQIMLERNISPKYRSLSHKAGRDMRDATRVERLGINEHSKNSRASTKSNKNKKIHNRKDGKFVIHEMDTKKAAPIKKKHSISFL